MKYERDMMVFGESSRCLQGAEREKLREVVFERAKNIFVPDEVETLRNSLSVVL
jgi:hypothetical protein